MAHNIKKIGFEDILVGDTIRIVDVTEAVVSERTEFELKLNNGETRLASAIREATTRQFHLVDRAIPPLPTEYGSVIVVEGSVFLLRASEAYINGVWQGIKSQYDVHGQREMRKKVESAGGFEVIR